MPKKKKNDGIERRVIEVDREHDETISRDKSTRKFKPFTLKGLSPLRFGDAFPRSRSQSSNTADNEMEGTLQKRRKVSPKHSDFPLKEEIYRRCRNRSNSRDNRSQRRSSRSKSRPRSPRSSRHPLSPQLRRNRSPTSHIDRSPSRRRNMSPSTGKDRFSPRGRDRFSPRGRDRFSPRGRDRFSPSRRDSSLPPRRDRSPPPQLDCFPASRSPIGRSRTPTKPQPWTSTHSNRQQSPHESCPPLFGKPLPSPSPSPLPRPPAWLISGQSKRKSSPSPPCSPLVNFRSKTQAPPSKVSSSSSSKKHAKIRTRSQSKSPKSPKSRGRAKTVAVKRLKSPKDSSLHNKSHKIKKKKSKTVVRKSKSNENSDDEGEKKKKKGSSEKKKKKKSDEIEEIAQVHPSLPYYKPPMIPQTNKNNYIQCRICLSYFEKDQEHSNKHISLHRSETFCVKVPRDQWFYDIEEAVAHLANNNFSKEGLKDKVMSLGLIEYPPSLVGYSCSACFTANSTNVFNFSSNEEFLSHVKANKCTARGKEESARVSWCRGCHTRFLSIHDLDIHLSKQKKKKKCFLSDEVLDRVFKNANQASAQPNKIKSEFTNEQNAEQPNVPVFPSPLLPMFLPPGGINPLQANPLGIPLDVALPGMNMNSEATGGVLLPQPGSTFPQLAANVKDQNTNLVSGASALSTTSFSSLNLSVGSLQPPDPTMNMECSPPRQVDSFNVYDDIQQPTPPSGQRKGSENEGVSSILLNQETLEQILNTVNAQKNRNNLDSEVRSETDSSVISFGRPVPRISPPTTASSPHSASFSSFQGTRRSPPPRGVVPLEARGRRPSREMPSSVGQRRRMSEDNPTSLEPSSSKPAEDDDCLEVIEEADAEACSLGRCFWNGEHMSTCDRLKISMKCGMQTCQQDDLHQNWGFLYNKYLKSSIKKSQLCPKLSFYVNFSLDYKAKDPMKRDKKTPVIPQLRIKSEITAEPNEEVDPRLMRDVYPSAKGNFEEKLLYLKHPHSGNTFLHATLNSKRALQRLTRNSN